jgi:molybdenum cofactor synthesis domain-containing protein
MEVALITVGDELLAGDTVNTNANWLAEQLSDRGVTVSRILSVPDSYEPITTHVTAYSDSFDAVIVTGGIGGTPDDITIEAVADAFDRELVVSELALSAVDRRLAELREQFPDRDLNVDSEAEATLPERSRPLLNEAGLAPGCVVENVYVLPGIPDELKTMYRSIVDEFSGDRQSLFLYTVEPEANIVWALEEAMDRFDVAVGCYPDRVADHNRLKITTTSDAQLTAASDWLLSNINASETAVSRDWHGDEKSNTDTDPD